VIYFQKELTFNSKKRNLVSEVNVKKTGSRLKSGFIFKKKHFPFDLEKGIEKFDDNKRQGRLPENLDNFERRIRYF
jgi:hypothetical protein